jgi:uncharacterized RDD family membrane protein YckC
MEPGATLSQHQRDTPQYARFVRRFRGMVIDWIVALLIVFGALFVATTVQTDGFSRLTGYIVVIVLLLYEPILVSATGSTIGHYLANLRVVDERHHGNVSFPKAVVRFLIKMVLGWYSFVVMSATRRNQALHDKLMRSTVQIRDTAKSRPGHYITERMEFTNPNLPSRKRRAAVILAYLIVAFAGFCLIVGTFLLAGILSVECTDNASRCSAGEKSAEIVAAVFWIAVSAWIIGVGWRGKLPGARVRAGS